MALGLSIGAGFLIYYLVEAVKVRFEDVYLFWEECWIKGRYFEFHFGWVLCIYLDLESIYRRVNVHSSLTCSS